MGFDNYPFLVDTNNTGAKVTSADLDLQRLKERGEVSGVRLGMTMDEAIARWGKPPSGYGPMGCLHGLATFIYTDAALGFGSNCLETIQISTLAETFGNLSRISKSADCLSILGSPTDQRTSGANSNLVYLSQGTSLRLDFHDDELVNIWLEHTASRAQPWKQEPKGANKPLKPTPR